VNKPAEAREQEIKERLIKTSRMYAMCQKAEVEDPTTVSALALAAFEEMPLRQALLFVRSNQANVEDLAWAYANSGTPEEFEARLQERIAKMKQTSGQR
jgi:hypothetical protein